MFFSYYRLYDVVHSEKKLYLIFEYLNQDLKKYMDSCPPSGMPSSLVKVCAISLFCVKYVFHISDFILTLFKGCRVRDHMVVRFSTTWAISAYHHLSCEFESRSRRRRVLDTTLCDKVCQWQVADRWFSPDTPVSSTYKTDHHDKTEILLKVKLNNITITLFYNNTYFTYDGHNGTLPSKSNGKDNKFE